MTARRRGAVVLWLGLATILVATTGSPLERNRRILNEPGDNPTDGKTVVPYNKRQQIIYLLNQETQSKRDKQPGRTVAMETYAKELSPDGRLVMPNATKLLVSEDFRGGGLKEMAVNKGEGPPNIIKPLNLVKIKSYSQTNGRESNPHEEQMNIAVKKSDSTDITEPRLRTVNNGSSPNAPQVNITRTQTDSLNSQNNKPLAGSVKINPKLKEEESSTFRKKNSFIRQVGRFVDGELLPPAKPIQPGVFEIGQNDIRDSNKASYARDGFSPHSSADRTVFLPEDRPAREWRQSGRWKHRHHYYRHRQPPLVVDRRPNVYYMPMYSGRSNFQMLPFTPGQEINSAPQNDPGQVADYGRQPVMMQPLVPMIPPAAQQGLPLLPPQPVLQSPYVQQPDARSGLYTVPLTAAPQQQVVYPFMALPALQQPQQQVQLVQQPPIEQGIAPEHLASHWTDEQGHARSVVNDEETPRPREYDKEKSYDSDSRDSRYDDDRYHEYSDNERRYHDVDRDRDRDEEERETERERLYRERDYYENSNAGYPDTRYEDNGVENANARSAPPPVPATEENNDEDDEEENESDANERILQDSKDEPPSTENDEGPPELERDEAPPNINYRPPDMESREQPSFFRIPSFSPRRRMNSPFAYPNRFSINTYAREQLLGPSVPLRERVLPRFMDTPPRRTPIESPNGDISEMSASEARFRERMRMELQAKDTIPRGFHSDSSDGLNNVVIRLNGEPLENASELRSRIINGRIVQGKGKIIKSKGPMRIRVTHKGKGRNRIKFIDIMSPQKYSITDSRSKIGRAPIVKGLNHNLKRNQIHKKNTNTSSTPQLRAKHIISTTTTARNTKVPGFQLKHTKGRQH